METLASQEAETIQERLRDVACCGESGDSKGSHMLVRVTDWGGFAAVITLTSCIPCAKFIFAGPSI